MSVLQKSGKHLPDRNKQENRTIVGAGIGTVAGYVARGSTIAAGAVIGSSICPGIGTVVGGLTGALAGFLTGAAVGNAVGKCIDKYVVSRYYCSGCGKTFAR
jgi:hypothetical protein